MLNTININLKTDIKTDRPATLPITLMSQDKNNNQFILRFTNGGESVTLDDTYTVDVLTKFSKSGTSRLTIAKVRQDYATWEFDTAYITQDEEVRNYVYVRKSGNLVVSADANCFVFSVDLSEIDKGAGKVAETYDENYQKHLDEFKENVNFEEIAQAEQARKEAEILRQESYDAKVDTAIVEADVVGKVDSKVTELTPQINSLTTQLAQTVTHTELDAQLATLLDGGPSIFMDSLAVLQSTYPNGASGVALVRETDPAKIYVWDGGEWKDFGDYQGISLRDGSVTTSKLGMKSVTPDRTSFIETSSNIFDIDTAVAGRVIGSDGTINNNSSYGYHGPYNVTPTESLQTKGIGSIAYYGDENQFLVRSGQNSTFGELSWVVPDGAYIAYVNFRTDLEHGVNRTIQLNRGSVLLPFENYFQRLKSLKMSSDNLETDSVTNTKIKDKSVGFNKVDFITSSSNLIDADGFTEGYVINAQGVVTANAQYAYSTKFDVRPNTKIIMRGPYYINYFDSYGNPITRRGAGNANIFMDTTPSNAFAAVVSIGMSSSMYRTRTMQLNYGEVLLDFEPYYLKIPRLKIEGPSALGFKEITKFVPMSALCH